LDIELVKRVSCAALSLAILGASLLGTPQAVAGDKRDYKSDNRRHDGKDYRRDEVERDLRRHEDERRAFVAGAVAQQHRDDYRDDRYRYGYDDRYRDRYYERDDHEDDVARVLIGVAVGAVATGVIMSNTNKQ
jgi:hypothetical protein